MGPAQKVEPSWSGSSAQTRLQLCSPGNMNWKMRGDGLLAGRPEAKRIRGRVSLEAGPASRQEGCDGVRAQKVWGREEMYRVKDEAGWWLNEKGGGAKKSGMQGVAGSLERKHLTSYCCKGTR